MSPELSPVENKDAEKKGAEKKDSKIVEKCRRGPEDGFPFVVDEVFKQRGPKPLPEVSVCLPEVSAKKGPRPGPHRAIKKTAAAESERSAVSSRNVAQRSNAIQVPFQQTPPDDKPFAVAAFHTANQLASPSAAMPGQYPDSDDGGVELPKHITASHGAVFARVVDSESDSSRNSRNSSGAQTPAATSEKTDAGRNRLSIDELDLVFAKLAALNKSHCGI